MQYNVQEWYVVHIENGINTYADNNYDGYNKHPKRYRVRLVFQEPDHLQRETRSPVALIGKFLTKGP